MQLSEAEIQVLACLYRAETDGHPTNLDGIEKYGNEFSVYKEDWTDSFDQLIDRNLIDGDESGYQLTAHGRPLGERYHIERPDQYWYYYQRFYPAAYASAVHSRFCEKVYGKNLCQEGQTDMAALEILLRHMNIREGESVIDLGCGAGVISEYIADTTGAVVTGMDYAEPAINEALKRTSDKRDRLKFHTENFNRMQIEAGSFDVAVSIDTLYIDEGLENVLSTILHGLKNGGRLGIYLNHFISKDDSQDQLDPQFSRLSIAFSNIGVVPEIYDYTKELKEFWDRLIVTTRELQDAYKAEGNGFIAENYVHEAEEDHLPEIHAGRVARYLYIVKT